MKKLFAAYLITAIMPSALAQDVATSANPNQFKLQTQHDEISGSVQSSKTLYGQAQLNQIDANVSTNLLHGSVAEQGGSSLSTVQHEVKSYSLSNSAPSIDILPSSMLRSRIVDKSAPALPTIQTPKSYYPMPTLAAQVSHAVPESELADFKQQLRAAEAGHHVQPQINSFYIQSPLQVNPESINTKAFITTAPANLSSQIETELAHPTPANDNELALAERQIAAELTNTQKQMKAHPSSLETEMKGVYTRLRQPPQLEMPSVQGQIISRPGESENGILWDEWHKRIAKLYDAALIKSIERSGNPSGSNTVSVTVLPNHHIAVKLAGSSNAKFDTATLQAYRSLEGDPALEYPTGSQRQTITFLVDNVHDSSASISNVNSQTLIGDKEVQHYKW